MRRIAASCIRWVIRYARVSDIFELCLLIIGCALGVVALEKESTWVGSLFAAYVCIAIVKFGIVAWNRGAKDKLKAQVLWGLFDMLNEQVFAGSNSTRFTLFQRDALGRNSIVPWYRYQKSGEDAITDASASQARYRRGEGLTGQSWNDAGEGEIVFASVPEFRDRREFEKYYAAHLGVTPDMVSRLSEYMEGVRAFFSVGYTDTRGRFLGVMSIDIQSPIVQDVENELLVLNNGEEEVEIRSEHLHLLSDTVRNVLRSFSVS